MNNRISALISAVFCGILLVGATPLFGQISVTSDSRTAFIEGPPVDMNQSTTATPLSPLNVSFNQSSEPYTANFGGTFLLSAAASQNSTVNLTGQTLNVAASGQVSFNITQTGGPGGNPSETGGRSEYTVTFQITTPSTYTVVEQTDHQTEPAPFSDIEGISEGAELLQGTSSVIPFPLWSQPSPAPVTFTGTLAPGTYTFTGNAFAIDVVHSGSANYSADLTVTATPEPTGLLPVALGMIALLRRRA